MNEIKRIKGFESGSYKCECGEGLYLYFNGGELDESECKCGRFYSTEYQEIDLVIYDKKDIDDDE